MLVKRCNYKTNYVLPVRFVKTNFCTLWYYDTEFKLFSAYRQLKACAIGIVPSYPVVYDNIVI